jgi:hypothetical protein
MLIEAQTIDAYNWNFMYRKFDFLKFLLKSYQYWEEIVYEDKKGFQTMHDGIPVVHDSFFLIMHDRIPTLSFIFSPSREWGGGGGSCRKHGNGYRTVSGC